jgi:hypothetical protein
MQINPKRVTFLDGADIDQIVLSAVNAKSGDAFLYQGRIAVLVSEVETESRDISPEETKELLRGANA